jgi:hypothetical protein
MMITGMAESKLPLLWCMHDRNGQLSLSMRGTLTSTILLSPTQALHILQYPVNFIVCLQQLPLVVLQALQPSLVHFGPPLCLQSICSSLSWLLN